MDGARLESLRKFRLWQQKKAEEGLEQSRQELDSARKGLSDVQTGREQGLDALEKEPDSLAWKELCYAYLACQEQRMTDALQQLSASEEVFLDHQRQWMDARNEVEKMDVLIEKDRKIQSGRASYREERRMDDLHSRNAGHHGQGKHT